VAAGFDFMMLILLALIKCCSAFGMLSRYEMHSTVFAIVSLDRIVCDSPQTVSMTKGSDCLPPMCSFALVLNEEWWLRVCRERVKAKKTAAGSA
jgi:hypothetical protein